MTKVELDLIPAKGLNAAIKALHVDGQRFQAQAHRVACSVLKHLGKTKDIRHTLAMLDAMPEAIRLNGLKQWLETYGPIKFSNPDEIKAGAPVAICVKDKATMLGDAMANPFWKFKATEGVAYIPMDINKELDRMVKRLEKDAKETGQDHSALIMTLKTANAPVENGRPYAAPNMVFDQLSH